MNVEVRETSIANLAIIEVDLQKIIEMIMEEENVALVLVQKEDEHVIGHVEIDYVTTLALGSRPRQGLIRLWAKKEAQK
jgi:predicted N-acetyltransferase YhbS